MFQFIDENLITPRAGPSTPTSNSSTYNGRRKTSIKGSAFYSNQRLLSTIKPLITKQNAQAMRRKILKSNDFKEMFLADFAVNRKADLSLACKRATQKRQLFSEMRHYVQTIRVVFQITCLCCRKLQQIIFNHCENGTASNWEKQQTQRKVNLSVHVLQRPNKSEDIYFP